MLSTRIFQLVLFLDYLGGQTLSSEDLGPHESSAHYRRTINERGQANFQVDLSAELSFDDKKDQSKGSKESSGYRSKNDDDDVQVNYLLIYR